MLAQRARQKERSQMVASCLAMGETAWSCRCLAPQTCSVLDLVRTERRTLRLAIACGDRSDRTLHPSQVAAFDHTAFRRKDQMSRGIIKRRCSSRRALGSHLAHPEEGPTASLEIIGTDLRTARLAIATGEKGAIQLHQPPMVKGKHASLSDRLHVTLRGGPSRARRRPDARGGCPP